MEQWLKSEQVKSYINACHQRQENHAFEKARCKEYFAELFYQDAQKGLMECPPALWVLAIFCRFLFASLRKPALDLMESGGHWNWPYWLGELFCCGGMVLQLAIAKNPQLSTTKARVTILVSTFVSHTMDAIAACYLGSRENDAFLNGVAYVSRIGCEFFIMIIGCWATLHTIQPQEVDQAGCLETWDQLPAEYKYWAESSLSNYRDEQNCQGTLRRSSRQRVQAKARASPVDNTKPV
ncbi:hypothetical protein TRV_04700 [Trichophyton verrucosum HKI 0517]|uniref:Uncharacterized protein n=1 Tax=Trichophyton verrucosum (strain HKI 0517) TaxID=663202 RepID=D4DC48_TRIVH|nr:uncharacterized protein TRV_04700 [Trichophyton verrucosum HKI 0517]EFE40565.1 hypothetical protein TRV_04700 [Trichophyton verrucosum HKI 0517]